jgi:hypothetical protein
VLAVVPGGRQGAIFCSRLVEAFTALSHRALLLFELLFDPPHAARKAAPAIM